jgi:hypothetical protein
MLLCLFRYELATTIKQSITQKGGRLFAYQRDLNAYRTLRTKDIHNIPIDMTNVVQTPFWKYLHTTRSLQQMFRFIANFVIELNSNYIHHHMIYTHASKFVVALYKFQMLIYDKYYQQCSVNKTCQEITKDLIINALNYQKYDEQIYQIVNINIQNGKQPSQQPPQHQAPQHQAPQQPQVIGQNIKQHRLKLLKSLVHTITLLHNKLFPSS